MTEATPLPSSPTRGEVPSREWGTILDASPIFTLPLVGRVGEGAKIRSNARAAT